MTVHNWTCHQCVCTVLQILGLDICADILVGDAMRRGISGGQKKRLTTGNMNTLSADIA